MTSLFRLGKDNWQLPNVDGDRNISKDSIERRTYYHSSQRPQDQYLLELAFARATLGLSPAALEIEEKVLGRSRVGGDQTPEGAPKGLPRGLGGASECNKRRKRPTEYAVLH